MSLLHAEAIRVDSVNLDLEKVNHGPTPTKRLLDLAGSALGLIILSPLFFAIALLVKLTSEGPVFFRQERIGYLGKPFTFYKFRSMYVSKDSDVHYKFVKAFISGKGSTFKYEDGAAVYKIVDDPRVTPLGKFLRKSSIDELPQLFNVLRGEMSLVGPRPPLPYEWDMYEDWHRARVTEAKPGITGLWQTHGRSSTTFDEMVRLDLEYARRQSVFLDLWLILLTLWIVVTTKGAY